jgi:hypothetical protein
MSKRKIRLELVSEGEPSDGKPRQAHPIVQRPVLAAFSWYDECFLSNQNVDRLRLVARAACLIEDLMATAQEHSPEGAGWVSGALGQALRAISEELEGSSVGALLTALEAIVPPERRALWPTQ